MQLKLASLVIFSAAFCSIALADDAAGKPTAPVQISIISESKLTPGGVGHFLISASSDIASDAFVINVIPPKGGKWMSGSKQWRGPVLPKQARQIRVIVRMPDKGVPTLEVNAGIEADDGSRMAASAVYSEPSTTSNEEASENHGRIVQRQSEPVVEYTLQ